MSAHTDSHQSSETDEVPGLGKKIAEITLAYVMCPKDSPAKGDFLGAILLTDYRARPMHFAYVAPIRPTMMQRLLYGSTLDEHVRIDVVTACLMKDLPQRPDLLFVDAPQLIPARRVAKIPTAYLAKEQTSDGNANPLNAVTYEVDPYSSDDEFVRHVIANLESACDLLEPFSRMREALKEAMKASG